MEKIKFIIFLLLLSAPINSQAEDIDIISLASLYRQIEDDSSLESRDLVGADFKYFFLQIENIFGHQAFHVNFGVESKVYFQNNIDYSPRYRFDQRSFSLGFSQVIEYALTKSIFWGLSSSFGFNRDEFTIQDSGENFSFSEITSLSSDQLGVYAQLGAKLRFKLWSIISPFLSYSTIFNHPFSETGDISQIVGFSKIKENLLSQSGS